MARKSRSGLSLIELLIFAGIFSAVMVGFITIMVAMIRIQSRQSAAAEVNQQSQFLLQQLQYHIERSSLVEIPQDFPTSTLNLRMRAAAEDPTVIRLSGGIVYIKSGGAVEEPITTSRVNVNNLTFTKRANPPGKDSVNLLFTMEYNTPNITQHFVQSLQTSVAKVSAANFDSDIRASSTNVYKIGTALAEWQSINNTIFFNGSNVGIGISPNAKLQVSGGDVYVDVTGRGMVLRSPDGTCWRITPTNAGNYSSASSTTCFGY